MSSESAPTSYLSPASRGGEDNGQNYAKISRMQTRIVFMGSPEFAVPILRSLTTGYPVVGVVTQPDRPAGRGRVLTPPPIKRLAEEIHIPVIQPKRLSEPEALQQLQSWSPDVIIVAAFGQILKPAVLDLPKFGCVNVHGSLLPRWRGAAPIQAAILHGDEETGITIMCMDPGVDTGQILRQKSLAIGNEDTAGSLAEKLSILGADLLMETLLEFVNGAIQPETQDDSKATYAPLIQKEDGLLDFTRPTVDLERQVRAYNPWPGAYTYWNNQVLKVHQAHISNDKSDPPGKRIVYHDWPAITT
ncbi:MAG TPA: methionyl-tRNA formyltransferase, partial [Anaerolineales bacterium]|nr:methionyl-tRNA formyltransferase [Anaerolineales bacterium]